MEHYTGIAAIIASSAALVKATADLITAIKKRDDDKK